MTELSGWSSRQYVLLVPSVVRSDAPQTACVQLHSLSEPVSLSVVLEYGTAQRTLFEEPVTENDFFKCGEFKVFFSFEATEEGVEIILIATLLVSEGKKTMCLK